VRWHRSETLEQVAHVAFAVVANPRQLKRDFSAARKAGRQRQKACDNSRVLRSWIGGDFCGLIFAVFGRTRAQFALQNSHRALLIPDRQRPCSILVIKLGEALFCAA